MKIAVDLDDVLTDTMAGVIAHHNELYHTNLTKDDFYSQNFSEIWGGTKQAAVDEILAFHSSLYGIDTPPIPEAVAAVATLKAAGHELYLVTGRYDEVMDQTRDWIEKYFPQTFSGIFNTNHFSLKTTPTTKAEVCKKIGATLLIDDNLDHALGTARAGISVFLIDHQWNKLDTEPENITRVFSWPEIVEKIKALA